MRQRASQVLKDASLN